MTDYDCVNTYTTVNRSPDGSWWWQATVEERFSGQAMHAGPATGYHSQQEAESACHAWVRRAVEG